MSKILGPNSVGLPGSESPKKKKKKLLIAMLSKVKSGSKKSKDRSQAARRMYGS